MFLPPWRRHGWILLAAGREVHMVGRYPLVYKRSEVCRAIVHGSGGDPCECSTGDMRGRVHSRESPRMNLPNVGSGSILVRIRLE